VLLFYIACVIVLIVNIFFLKAGLKAGKPMRTTKTAIVWLSFGLVFYGVTWLLT
jgi:hypothetical protein